MQRALGQPPRWLWFYVVATSIISVLVLLTLFAKIPHVPDAPPPPTENRPPINRDKKPRYKSDAERFSRIRNLFVMTMGMTLCCGALGGCLYDMRGLIKHSAAGDFDPLYQASYLLRPFAGAMSGFIVFLVLVGGLFSLEIQPPTNQTVEQDWIILRRQLPFMAFAMLAGYASHVFMMKLKDISEVVFSSPERANPGGEARP